MSIRLRGSGNYHVEEVSLADTRRLIGYQQAGVYGTQFNLKGFAYPWVLTSREWSGGERVLDVGAGYSELPMHIAGHLGCETWIADDFGQSVDDPFWRRRRDPEEHTRAHPEVRFVRERLGNPVQSSLPEAYFDVVYSISTLEHVPVSLLPAVWAHMALLVRPGGEMLHAVDIPFPSGGRVAPIAAAAAFDILFPLLPGSLCERFPMQTPKAHARRALAAVGAAPSGRLKGLGIVNMILNPDVVIDPLDTTYNRIVKDGMKGGGHWRVATLLIRLKREMPTERKRS